MMQLMEQQDFTFTQDDKRLLLGYAFHQRDLDCVHDAVIHIAAVREKSQEDRTPVSLSSTDTRQK